MFHITFEIYQKETEKRDIESYKNDIEINS